MSQHALKHNRYAYGYRKCRCEVCVTDWATYQRELRARHAARPITRPHGLYTTYLNYGCRCDLCTAASTQQSRDFRARHRPPPKNDPPPPPTLAPLPGTCPRCHRRVFLLRDPFRWCNAKSVRVHVCRHTESQKGAK